MILVTGAESTGTRMMTRIVNEAGGQALHWPMPQGAAGEWRPIPNSKFSAALVMVRDVFATMSAQVAAGHVRDAGSAASNMRRAYAYAIYELFVRDVPFWLVSYESLARPAAVDQLCELLGLDGSLVLTEWNDANAKYYGGEHWEDHRNVNGLPVNAAALAGHRRARESSCG